MTNRTSRIRGSAARTNAPAAPASSSTDPQISPGPGTQAVRAVLGEDGYRRLADQKLQRGTALGALAGLVQDTSREADRLHGKLRRHAAQVRDRLGDALNPHGDPAFVPVTGLLTSSGHATDLHAARFAQQMNQLALVLDSYQSAVRHI
ncbi:hypothetical protein BIV25_39920 [Streptomyces sp. MUSC 14]|uniref:hypothetical protein n=1 Tax=Streptomyces sp. MUSC 14 TaxID=1354889 RepID=UPI0008F58F16|nr:hypothetical protein [Streptomyces sp. MUSC 14]OIJ87091.1 hypothetical protein BIV25_39920 [Streptomyces sp. MUSC 14]